MTKLNQLINILRGNRKIFIQTHNSPDPDAIATAFALKKLLDRKGIDATICYKGEIEKYSTLRMIELLNIDITFIESIDYMSKDDYIILVDSQKYNSNITDFIGDEVACIDHHPVFVNNKYKFKDIRDNIGACSSILASYFIENNIGIDEDTATALLYGIKMDTLDLSRGVSDLDIDMFYYLYKRADKKKISKIQKNTLEFSDLNAYGNAIQNIKIYRNIGFVNIGFDCPDVLLACISDFILSLKEIDFVVVYCEKENKLKFSVRNESENLDAGKIINEAISGYGNGGGHKTMAGGVIPKKNMCHIIGEVDTFIQYKFLETIDKYESDEKKDII
ncbi:DHHA1 domain-containing protein [Clostridium cavendishii DSM 21758]|uniref:DHHA1 domain-containing protein n=1 Tax=Clostridium cavendishii DSM 21758 TaxID=1121302 RepID=A0A1M6B7V5_9CLOT|nr:DHHA1 domain-containing protein [Clostridium cavendishii]SHI44834.1 DHHA1 domain-containing protein [Clostridium cavendishii DSM 21758]